MAAGDIWSVTYNSLFVRIGPGTNNKTVGGVARGDELKEFDRGNDSNGTLWIKHDRGGWSSTEGLKLIRRNPGESETITENSPAPSGNELEDGAGYQPAVSDIMGNTNSNVSDSEFVKLKNVSGVFGLPYQFLPNTDIRLSGDTITENIGFEYGEKIIERIPLLFISPGRANFMTKYSKKNKQNVLEWMINNIGSSNNGSLDDLLSKDGRYYTFEYDRHTYYKYVNPMCRLAARFLGIQDIRINGTKLDRMNWEEFSDNGISSIGDFGAYTSIPFYVDTDTSVSENFSNSTTQSTLSSSVNSISDMGRELNFLLGYGASATGVEALAQDADIQSNIENVNETISKLLGKGNFLSNLSKHLTTVATGGKLIFPEIWSDSSFSRSYNCEFKFISPDPSKLSVYLNVLVPLFHLLGLVAPQTVKDNPNGFVNPFLIRAMYKGFFNIDMGIITDMSVTRGAENQWTPEGIPTCINVSISIKDLYSAMSITSSENIKYDTLSNTALMDYIANLCGINVFKPEIGRMIDMWIVNNFSNKVDDLFKTNIWTRIEDKVQNLIMNIYR